MPPELSGPGAAIEIVLVEAAACHLCDDAVHALAAAAAVYPLTIRRVDIASPEGRELVRRFRAPMPPIVVIDDQLLGWGRLSRGKLRGRLEELTAAGAAR